MGEHSTVVSLLGRCSCDDDPSVIRTCSSISSPLSRVNAEFFLKKNPVLPHRPGGRGNISPNGYYITSPYGCKLVCLLPNQCTKQLRPYLERAKEKKSIASPVQRTRPSAADAVSVLSCYRWRHARHGCVLLLLPLGTARSLLRLR